MTPSDEFQQEKEAAQQEVFERKVLPYKSAIQLMMSRGITYKQMANAPGSYSAPSTFERLGDKSGTRSPAPYTIEAVRAALRKYAPEELLRIEQEEQEGHFDSLSVEQQHALLERLSARLKQS